MNVEHLTGLSLVPNSNGTSLARVGPDFGAIAGGADLAQIVGSLLTFGLIFSVGMVVVSAGVWAIASSQGSWQAAAKARMGVMVALCGAALTGAAPALANWLLRLGSTL